MKRLIIVQKENEQALLRKAELVTVCPFPEDTLITKMIDYSVSRILHHLV
jgi:hypothetical protein